MSGDAPRRSSCILLCAPSQEDAARVELWLARREDDLPFLGGFFAPPGGGMEDEDHTSGTDPFLGCARRELHEELGLALPPERFRPFGRWTTPEGAPTRYETEFFVVTLSPEERPRVTRHPEALKEAHLVEWAWHTPEAWLDASRHAELLLSAPILAMLRGLATQHAAILSDAALARVDEADASPLDRYAHTADTFCVPLKSPTLAPATHTQCYVVRGDERFVLIDPGTPDRDELQKLDALCEALEAEGATLQAIVLTHHHIDHISGVPYLKEKHGDSVQIWAHPETASRLDAIGSPRVDRTLNESDLLELGPEHTLEVLFTPGHAPGHIALLHHQSHALFSGDMVASQGTILIAPPDGHMGDYLNSLQRLAALFPSSLHPAHGWPIRDAAGRLLAYHEHRLAREEMVRQALAAHDAPQRALELVPQVYQDVPQAVWPIAALSLEAHLRHLVEIGDALTHDDPHGDSTARYSLATPPRSERGQ